MSTIPFEAFLAKFSQLKAILNSNPHNLRWRAKNDASLGELASDVSAHFRGILRAFANSHQKFAVAPTPSFAASFREYREQWKDVVEEVGADWIMSRWAELEKTIDWDAVQSEKPELVDKISEPPPFDATIDNPVELFEELLWSAEMIQDILGDTEGSDKIQKALQAWSFLESAVGMDLENIWRRWSRAQTVIVPPHVATANGPGELGDVFHLLGEAHRAFVFGALGAAVAMCRALTETVLKRHYGAEDGDLERMIFLAEQRYLAVRQLKLDSMRRLANRVLHRNELAPEDAVLEFLTTVKQLIETAPVRSP